LTISKRSLAVFETKMIFSCTTSGRR